MSEQAPTLHATGESLGRPGKYRVMTGEPIIHRKDWRDDTLTLNGLLEFIKVRKEQILSRSPETHICVDPKSSSITFVEGEHGGMADQATRYTPTVVLTGSSTFTQDRNDVAAIMSGLHRPHELGMKLRELPHLFADEASWADAVKNLRSLTLKISKAVKDTSSDETGEREKAIHLVIENGAVAIEWSWEYRIYEGTPLVTVPVRLLYEADESMSGIYVRVHNPRKVMQERQALEDMLNDTVAEIRKVLGDAVPIIYRNGGK